MAKDLGEETKFTVSIKTLIAVAVAIATFVGGYYKLHSEIEAAKELPKPGKGVYIVDPGDASAKETCNCKCKLIAERASLSGRAKLRSKARSSGKTKSGGRAMLGHRSRLSS